MTVEIGALAGALAKAQGQFGTVKRDKEVVVQKKSGGEYRFKYAPLDSILEAVRKPLADQGLVVVQILDDGDLVTSLAHESGAIMSGRVSLPPTTDVQAYGSAITYLRRYAIQALLGIAAEDDDDGNRAAGNDHSFGAPKATATAEDELEFLGKLSKSGTVMAGSAALYKAEWRETIDGHAIGFRLKGDGDKDIPQVMILPNIGEPLYVATSGKPSLVGASLTVKGRLYNVRHAGRATFYRLVVGETPSDFVETDEVRIPPLEAPSEELFPEGTAA